MTALPRRKALLRTVTAGLRSRAKALRRAAALVGLATWLATSATADPALPDPAALCDAAAARASAETGVPLPVLQAIALTESGRTHRGRFRAWPWTLNAEGRGEWFPDRRSAEARLDELRAEGIRSIDIGCFQVNLRWHGGAFPSPEAMFTPEANALYAARFLAGLEAELGGWEAAAGAYHSRTPALAERYTARFRTHLARLEAETPSRTAPPPEAPLLTLATAPSPPRRTTEYPLFQPGPASALGSTVPLGDGRGALLLAAARPLR